MPQVVLTDNIAILIQCLNPPTSSVMQSFLSNSVLIHLLTNLMEHTPPHDLPVEQGYGVSNKIRKGFFLKFFYDRWEKNLLVKIVGRAVLKR